MKGALVFEVDSDQKVCDFVSRYITAKLPDPITQPELYKKVTEVQMHSKNHFNTCVKYSDSNCHFGFPKQPAPATMIIIPGDNVDAEKEVAALSKLTTLKLLLNEPENTNLSLQRLLALCELTLDECLCMTAKSSSVILKRDPKDSWVNGYNRNLLEAWDANLGIQFILNACSCIAYMCSYISKAQHGLSEYLKTQKNKRACGLHMKKCTRSVIFVQTDNDVLKMSYPCSFLEYKTPNSINVWMSGLPDKYKSRPETPEF